MSNAFPSRKVSILLIAVALIAFTLAMMYEKTQPTVIQTACTQEAKICPDGSAVSRTGPNCEFAPCPTLHDNHSDSLQDSI